MKPIRIHVLMLALISFASCEKEQADYRETYTGDFLFTTVVMSWQLNTDTTGPVTIVRYDTSEFQGYIRKYEVGDDDIDLYSDSDPLFPDSAVFIQFMEHSAITTLLESDGTLVPRGGYHYSCSGSFLHIDSLEFSVNGLGGLGMGWNYNVYGSRK